MKKSLIIILIIIILSAGGLVYYFSRKNAEVKLINLRAPVIQINTDNLQEERAARASITIQNFSFNPSIITIRVGSTITWTNNDQAPHIIAGNSFGSGTLRTGDKFSYTFNETGIFDYHCAIHPSMRGQIIVTE